MERLQAALDAARKKRGQPDVAAATAATAVAVTSVGHLWQALAAFTPEARELQRHRVVTGEATDASTPFDILRTKILLQMRQNGWTRLGITSPAPRSGKSTTACNLALGLGRQGDLRSILFDLDLRNPSVHQYFGKSPAQTISSVLTGEVRFADQAFRIGSNVAVSMGNRIEPDPTRLLLSDQTAAVLDDIQAAYQPDLMVFDLPSVLAGDDTRAFLKNVDCALIIARANVTRYGHFDACEREIAEHTNVLGVVLNGVRNLAASPE